MILAEILFIERFKFMKNSKYIMFYLLGAAIMIAGVIMFIVSIVGMASDMDTDSTRFVVPGEQEIKIEEPGKYIIYYEYQSTIDGVMYSTGNADISGLGVLVINKSSDKKVDVTASTMNSTYSMNGRSGASMFEFEIDEPTDVIIMVDYVENEGPNVVFNVSPDIAIGMLSGMGAILGYFFGGGVIGGAIIILTIVFHVRARKKYKLEQQIDVVEVGEAMNIN